MGLSTSTFREVTTLRAMKYENIVYLYWVIVNKEEWLLLLVIDYVEYDLGVILMWY